MHTHIFKIQCKDLNVLFLTLLFIGLLLKLLLLLKQLHVHLIRFKFVIHNMVNNVKKFENNVSVSYCELISNNCAMVNKTKKIRK